MDADPEWCLFLNGQDWRMSHDSERFSNRIAREITRKLGN